MHKTEDGGMILANVKIDDKNKTLTNIYAPNNQNVRKNFFQEDNEMELALCIE